MNFLDFVNEHNKVKNGEIKLLEAFSNNNMEHVFELISNLLSKHINNLIPLVGMVNTHIDNEECISKQFLILDKNTPYKSSGFQINWLKKAGSLEAYSIDFFKDATDVVWLGKGKSDLSIKTLGTSIVAFLPVIWTVINNNFKLTKQELLTTQQSIFKGNVKESLLNIGGLTFYIYENLDNDKCFNVYSNNINCVYEKVNSDLMDYKRKKRKEALDAYNNRHDSPEALEISKRLSKEYDEILSAINNGAETLDDLRAAINKNGSKIEVVPSKEEEKMEETIENKKDPEQVFKEMQKYIKMVINGIQPSLIICGAPGVGKTYRVKQQLRAAGYSEDNHMTTIKGKCTPRALYTALYDFKKKGDITLIDDADGLVGPKAPEESINILKAALDSTADDEGRLVTWSIAGKLLDNDGIQLPKKFYYNGGCIVLTNYRAGQLDTALRGRSFIQDINFGTDEILSIIKDLLPKIEPQSFSMKSKLKAYDYLVELNEQGSDMELSLRTFNICAKLFQTAEGDNDFTDEDVKSMIKEQMKLQYQRGGIKY